MPTNKPSFIRRAAPALVIAAVAVGVVSRFDTGATALVASTSQTTGDTNNSSSSTAGGSTSSGSSSSNNSSGNSSASNGSSSSSSGSSSSSSACGTQVTGDTINIYEAGGHGGGNYGQIAVTAWVNNGKVCKVSTNYQAYDGRSQMIDQQAVPMLDTEAVQAGSANISMISGATYTSQSYAQSLQSAIDKA